MINVCTFDLILSSTFNGEGLYFILQARLFFLKTSYRV